MSQSNWTLADCAQQYVGMREVLGHQSNPAILAMLKLDANWPEDDATPWCSGAVNWWAFNMGLERSQSLRARSWLLVGKPVPIEKATGNTVVVLSRTRWRPGPEVIKAPGHVGVYLDHTHDKVLIVGGNQGNKVSERWYPRKHVLGLRKLGRV